METLIKIRDFILLIIYLIRLHRNREDGSMEWHVQGHSQPYGWEYNGCVDVSRAMFGMMDPVGSYLCKHANNPSAISESEYDENKSHEHSSLSSHHANCALLFSYSSVCLQTVCLARSTHLFPAFLADTTHVSTDTVRVRNC